MAGSVPQGSDQSTIRLDSRLYSCLPGVKCSKSHTRRLIGIGHVESGRLTTLMVVLLSYYVFSPHALFIFRFIWSCVVILYRTGIQSLMYWSVRNLVFVQSVCTDYMICDNKASCCGILLRFTVSYSQSRCWKVKLCTVF